MRELILRLHRGDEQVLLLVVACRKDWLDRAVGRITHLGGATVTVSAAGFMLLAGSAPARRAVFALIGSHLAVQLVKRTICRSRPRLPVGIQSLMEPPDRFSFPSGHAAAALSIALGVGAARPMLAPFAIGAALVIGFSRCYLGVHYPGDVVAGWALASAAFAMSAMSDVVPVSG